MKLNQWETRQVRNRCKVWTPVGLGYGILKCKKSSESCYMQLDSETGEAQKKLLTKINSSLSYIYMYPSPMTLTLCKTIAPKES